MDHRSHSTFLPALIDMKNSQIKFVLSSVQKTGLLQAVILPPVISVIQTKFFMSKQYLEAINYQCHQYGFPEEHFQSFHLMEPEPGWNWSSEALLKRNKRAIPNPKIIKIIASINASRPFSIYKPGLYVSLGIKPF